MLRANGRNKSQHFWANNVGGLLRPCWLCCANECTDFQQYWDLQWILGRIQPIRLWRPCVMRVWPQQFWKNLKEELCKRIQHYCATLRRSRDKSCYLKSLTVFKLCATTPRVQKDATMLRPFAPGYRKCDVIYSQTISRFSCLMVK